MKSNRRYLRAADFPGDPKQKQCRVCCGPLPKGRRALCGPACSERARVLTSWSTQAARAIRRDKVCVVCGADARKLNRIIQHARRLDLHGGWETETARLARRRAESRRTAKAR